MHNIKYLYNKKFSGAEQCIAILTPPKLEKSQKQMPLKFSFATPLSAVVLCTRFAYFIYNVAMQWLIQ